MSIYRYSGASVVKEAAFRHSKNRLPVALLSAADTATPEQLTALRSAIDAAGWQQVPAYVEGKPILQVSGFKQESELDELLRGQRFAQGQAVITGQQRDSPASTPRERIERNSLKLAGWLNILGNAQLMIGGAKKHENKKRDYYRAAGGGLLLLGAANLARYGNAKAEHYAQEVTQDLEKYIRQEGGQTPVDGFSPHTNDSHSQIENFLYRYPAQVTLGIDTIGATSNLISGIKASRTKGNWGGLGFGIISVGLKLVSWLIPERARDERKSKDRNLFEKAADWVRERPLRFYGYGSLIGDFALGRDAYEQRLSGNKNYIFTVGAAVSYTLADLMMTLSSKNHVNAGGKFTEDEQRSIEATAAASIAATPEGQRIPMAQKIGGFLAKRKEMRGDAGSISKAIAEQAAHRQENPWTQRVNQVGDTVQANNRGM